MKNINLLDFKKLSNTVFVNFDYKYHANTYIRGVSIDSRNLKIGDIFWSIKGENFDGHHFVLEAVKKGAVAVVISSGFKSKYKTLDLPVIVVDDTLSALQNFALLHRKKFKIPLLGITGTNGKTTTKEMIAWCLKSKYNVLKTIGNLNNLIGVPLTLLRLKSENDLAIVEMGTNQPGEIKKLVSITKPNAGLITNIGRGHLQNFSSIDSLTQEKLSLYRGINNRGNIFLNIDDSKLPEFKYRKKTLCTYSLKNERARVKGELVELDQNGNGIWKLNKKTIIKMKIPGMHHIQNALAASAVALHFGMKHSEIKQALEEYQAFDKRMQIIKSEDVVFINDSYNANPDSFIPALNTLRHIAEKNNARKVVVMGDMLELGIESENIHYDLIMSMLDYDINAIFTIGRFCDIVVHELKEKGFKNIYWFKNHVGLAKSLKKYLQKGDYCLIKGSRGMQMEKVLGYI